MILGGSRYALPVIEAAHELGVYVITCDYLPDNIAHKYSDEYCNVSIIDKEATLKAAKNLKIDGIMSRQHHYILKQRMKIRRFSFGKVLYYTFLEK